MGDPSILGLVLAGGLARRMGGGDKARIRIGGKTILERVLARLAPQCGAMILNANGDPARFGDTGLPVVPDTVPDFAGPLAGILAGLDWAAANAPEVTDVVSVPGDCPFLPPDLVPRLERRARRPTCRWPAHAPAIGGIRWSACGRSACGAICARRWSRTTCARSRPGPPAMASPSPTGRPYPSIPFFNVNTPEDAAEAERIAAQQCDH